LLSNCARLGFALVLHYEARCRTGDNGFLLPTLQEL
jgi:hypothetical protein